MISDSERLFDGFRGLPSGMDGSKDPPQTPNTAAWFATNVTFRGGNGPKTRPGFRMVPSIFWRNPQPIKTVTIAISDGVATATVTGGGTHGYDDGDKVTVSGASASALNATHTIKVTGTSTFTFPTAASGTITGTIKTVRDVDASYAQDSVNSSTSRTRYEEYVRDAEYIQGAIVYQDPIQDNPSQLILVTTKKSGSSLLGFVVSLNFNENSCYVLNIPDPIAGDVQAFMVQAEKFVIIQTGKDEPRIYDGYTLQRASYYGNLVVPVGKQMAYGQGRLFVAVNDGTEIAAGDLVFGGSTTYVEITSSTATNPAKIVTAANHGFSTDDQITIAGHSSTPYINSTYNISTAGLNANEFHIPAIVTSAGSGGYASKFNAGTERDLLSFTENTYLNEGGNFSPSSKVGRIVALAFLPVQDTSTGQGDLIAFCERGAVTFQVSAPRDQWKSIEGFQRILFDTVGSTSSDIASVNGDLFFRSLEGNGIRTYRNARAESQSYGLTPVSAEIDPILEQDTPWLLDRVNFSFFDNRLLMTCWPRAYPKKAADQNEADDYASHPTQTIYNGIAVLDFRTTSSGRGKSAAVFDGVWTGLNVAQLVTGLFDKVPRCLAIGVYEDNGFRRFGIWDITKNDEYDTVITGRRRVQSAIVTKAFNFNEEATLKKLIRCDLWFDSLGGGSEYPFECELAYRPDDYPNFTTWQRFERVFETEFLLESKNIQTLTEQQNLWALTNVTVGADTTTDPIFEQLVVDKIEETDVSGQFYLNNAVSVASGTDYTYSVYAKAAERNILALTLSGSPWSSSVTGWFKLEDGGSVLSGAATAAIQDLGSGWYRCSVSGKTTSAGTSNAVIQLGIEGNPVNGSYQGVEGSGLFVWGSQFEVGEAATAYDPDPPKIPNYERGYAPQVKFPAPPRTANLATDVPAYLGFDFTLRVSWVGRARLGRLMLHGHKLIEAVGGGSL